MDDKLQAHDQNRTYYFQVVDKKPNEIAISMYNTAYTFVPVGNHWDNHKANKMTMASGLIAAIMVAVGIS